ncbi:hypothetical protein AgCh_013204 [Apium graveolens]
MLMFLEAIDDSYVDIINSGSPYPKKLLSMTPEVLEYYIRKKNLNGQNLRKLVIACKIAKEIWDALETQCQGIMAIKRNIRAVLVQEYEQFNAKADESITDIYDRFLTMLNDISLVGKEYDREDSNKKFLRALLEDWDTQASIIMHQYDLDLLTLDEVYGMLKTHNLEI